MILVIFFDEFPLLIIYPTLLWNVCVPVLCDMFQNLYSSIKFICHASNEAYFWAFMCRLVSCFQSFLSYFFLMFSKGCKYLRKECFYYKKFYWLIEKALLWSVIIFATLLLKIIKFHLNFLISTIFTTFWWF